MKKLNILIFLTAFLFVVAFTSSSSRNHSNEIIVTNNTNNTMAEDFFKKELQESVYEFLEDIGADPDTCYIPFQ